MKSFFFDPRKQDEYDGEIDYSYKKRRDSTDEVWDYINLTSKVENRSKVSVLREIIQKQMSHGSNSNSELASTTTNDSDQDDANNLNNNNNNNSTPTNKPTKTNTCSDEDDPAAMIEKLRLTQSYLVQERKKNNVKTVSNQVNLDFSHDSAIELDQN